MSQIPIENIYYLLCYAWNKLDERNKIQVNAKEFTEILNLFARVLINSTKKLLKKGIDKSYIDYNEDIFGIKGKLHINQTLKSNLLSKRKTNCSFDDFSPDVILNRILVSTLYRLSKTKGLDDQLKKEIITIRRMLAHIQKVEITSSIFKNIRFHRNNHFYGFIINICKIIFENSIPSKEPGTYLFSDFTEDERKMNKLFEDFIRNFYKIEQRKYTSVKREIIKWRFSTTDKNNEQYLPQMLTDITLENEEEKIIIDTKYYQETMKLYYNKEKIASSNLYQLFSYLVNQQNFDAKSRKATGILLYPTIEQDYDINYIYEGHNIRIKTINLNTNWESISLRLKTIINSD